MKKKSLPFLTNIKFDGFLRNISTRHLSNKLKSMFSFFSECFITLHNILMTFSLSSEEAQWKLTNLTRTTLHFERSSLKIKKSKSEIKKKF